MRVRTTKWLANNQREKRLGKLINFHISSRSISGIGERGRNSFVFPTRHHFDRFQNDSQHPHLLSQTPHSPDILHNTPKDEENNHKNTKKEKLVNLTIILLAILVAIGASQVLTNNNSDIFIGESKEFEQDLEEKIKKQYNFSYRKLILKTGEVIFLTLLFKDKEKAIKVTEELIKEYPRLFIGQLLLAFIDQQTGNLEGALSHFTSAKLINEKYPTDNELLLHLLPDEENFFVQGWKPIYTEVVPNSVWAINAPYYFPPNPTPVQLQCSVVRLNKIQKISNNENDINKEEEEEGGLVIINPIKFTKETRDFINKLGKVKGVITTTSNHGDAIARIIEENYWPEAVYYGTDLPFKHTRPSLPLVYLDEKTNPFGEELTFQKIEGQIFSETLFFHTPSNSLLGVTDLILPTNLYSVDHFSTIPHKEPPFTLSMRLYVFALGMIRGEDSSTYLALQNYHFFFIHSPEKFRESLKILFDKKIDHVILGHGGIFGKEGKILVRQAFEHVYSHHYRFNFVDRLYHQFAFAYNYNLITPMIRSICTFFISKI